MTVFLVHHGEALEPTVDMRRPLSAAGVSRARHLAERAARLGMRPGRVWHSGKLRARETATIFWQVCNPLADLAAVRGLQAGDPPEWILDRLAGETRDVALVGHLPHLGLVRQALTDAGSGVFPAHGAVAIELVERRGVERWSLEAAGAPE